MVSRKATNTLVDYLIGGLPPISNLDDAFDMWLTHNYDVLGINFDGTQLTLEEFRQVEDYDYIKTQFIEASRQELAENETASTILTAPDRIDRPAMGVAYAAKATASIFGNRIPWMRDNIVADALERDYDQKLDLGFKIIASLATIPYLEAPRQNPYFVAYGKMLVAEGLLTFISDVMQTGEAFTQEKIPQALDYIRDVVEESKDKIADYVPDYVQGMDESVDAVIDKYLPSFLSNFAQNAQQTLLSLNDYIPEITGGRVQALADYGLDAANALLDVVASPYQDLATMVVLYDAFEETFDKKSDEIFGPYVL